mmetsp:Transcript_55890/g.166207  ORF Transcript_55890/g.166207 Transcript_55890/m.166207 type:complete len:229 (+) Transcript_55890:512-1198(+)
MRHLARGACGRRVRRAAACQGRIHVPCGAPGADGSGCAEAELRRRRRRRRAEHRPADDEEGRALRAALQAVGRRRVARRAPRRRTPASVDQSGAGAGHRRAGRPESHHGRARERLRAAGRRQCVPDSLPVLRRRPVDHAERRAGQLRSGRPGRAGAAVHARRRNGDEIGRAVPDHRACRVGLWRWRRAAEGHGDGCVGAGRVGCGGGHGAAQLRAGQGCLRDGDPGAD